MSSVMIDVREKDEFDAEHVEGAIHIPLSSFGKQAPSILKNLEGKQITLLCRSGARAKMAQNEVQTFNCKLADVAIYEGGLLRWKEQGLPTIQTKKNHFPILRQVQLIAGLLILTSTVLALTVSLSFLGLTLFIGAGLTVAGATGFCGMAKLLDFAPWNRIKTK